MGAALLPLSSPCHARVHPHSVPGLVAPSWTAASHPDHHPGGAEERASSRSSASSRAPSSSSPASTRLPALPTPQPQSCSFLEAAAAPRRPSGPSRGPQAGRQWAHKLRAISAGAGRPGGAVASTGPPACLPAPSAAAGRS